MKLFHWKLAQGQSPTCYLNADAIKPLFTVGQAVKTIYGRGYIESIRLQSGDYVVKLDHWKLAQKQSPTLYLAHDSIQPLFSVFEKVKTVYGQGFVQAVREKDFVVKVNFSPSLLRYHTFSSTIHSCANLILFELFSTIFFIKVSLTPYHLPLIQQTLTAQQLEISRWKKSNVVSGGRIIGRCSLDCDVEYF